MYKKVFGLRILMVERKTVTTALFLDIQLRQFYIKPLEPLIVHL